MPKGYLLVTEQVNDPAGFHAYLKAAAPTMSEGVKILAVDANPDVLEGEWHGLLTPRPPRIHMLYPSCE